MKPNPSILFALGAAAAGCGGRASPVCSADPAPAADAVVTTLTLEPTAGGAPFALGAPMRTDDGVAYEVDLLRFYVSHVALVTAAGDTVPAVLADDAGAPLEYGVALVDYAVPGSEVLRVLAAPGTYEALSLSIGVPHDCAGGAGVLNHENASEQDAPLDVDTDMYWGWDPGYVFFKIEGHAGATGFVFHVGDDDRYTPVTIPAAIEVATPAAHRVALDVDRVLIGLTPDHTVHGGPEATTIADHLAHAEVFQWID